MIKNLIFDFGKVLVDYDFEGFFQKYIPDDERRKALSEKFLVSWRVGGLLVGCSLI